jgi:hypothetical protein
MGTNRIEKRLNAIEQSQKRPAKFIVSWSKPENSLAYMLSNGMKTEKPGVFELHWAGDHLKSDAEKIRWIRHLPAEKIDRCRQKWENSDYKRDRIALSELERFLAEIVLCNMPIRKV